MRMSNTLWTETARLVQGSTVKEFPKRTGEGTGAAAG
jgi:hypothetical protein